jgi:hypothetical protein
MPGWPTTTTSPHRCRSLREISGRPRASGEASSRSAAHDHRRVVMPLASVVDRRSRCCVPRCQRGSSSGTDAPHPRGRDAGARPGRRQPDDDAANTGPGAGAVKFAVVR